MGARGREWGAEAKRGAGRDIGGRGRGVTTKHKTKSGGIGGNVRKNEKHSKFQIPSSRLQISDVRFRISDSIFQITDFRFRNSCLIFQVFMFRFLEFRF